MLRRFQFSLGRSHAANRRHKSTLLIFFDFLSEATRRMQRFAVYVLNA